MQRDVPMLIDKIANIQQLHTDVNQAQAQAHAPMEGHTRQTTVTETEEKKGVRMRQRGEEHPRDMGRGKEQEAVEGELAEEGEGGGEERLERRRVHIVI